MVEFTLRVVHLFLLVFLPPNHTTPISTPLFGVLLLACMVLRTHWKLNHYRKKLLLQVNFLSGKLSSR